MSRRLRRGMRRLLGLRRIDVLSGRDDLPRGDGQGTDAVVVEQRQRVDADDRRGSARHGRAVREALGVLRVGAVERELSTRHDVVDATVEHVGRREERDAGVLVHVVEPRDELLAPGPAMHQRRERAGVVRLVLEGLELRLGKGVVVADVGSAEAANHTQRGQQLGEPVRPHRAAAICVDDERARRDAVARDGVGEQLLGVCRVLALGDHPADDHPAEQVDGHVQVVEDAGQRTAQLGDVPGPHLVWRGGVQRGLRVLDGGSLCSPLGGLVGRSEHAVHGAGRGHVRAARQHRRVDLVRGLVAELFGVQHLEQRRTLVVAKPPRARCADRHRRRTGRSCLAVERCAADAERSARSNDGHLGVVEILD